MRLLGIFTGKCVGIIGGFGAYATFDFYGRLLDSFAVESERDYPNMIIDNVFSMPSRTRALLTGEGQTEIVETIANSMKKMLDYDVDCMVMICGTAHYFLPYVYEKLPEAKDKVINILEATGKHLAANNIDKVLILAAEGTLKQKLYSRTFDVRIKIEQVKMRISHSPNRGIIETGGISPWQTILTSNLSWMQSSTTRNMRSLG